MRSAAASHRPATAAAFAKAATAFAVVAKAMRLVAVAGGQPAAATEWATVGALTELVEAMPGAIVDTIAAVVAATVGACSFQSR